VEREVQSVAETRRFESKGFKFKCAFLHSRKQKLQGGKPTGEFWRFGDKSLNRISGGDGQKSLGK
jgi:hypothetical protein